MTNWRKYSSLPYVLPFAVFLFFIAIQRYVPLDQRVEFPLRVAILTAVLWVFSRDVIDVRVKRWISSTLLGIGVFAIWVAPDVIWPAYRTHWLFENSITGGLASSLSQDVRNDWLTLTFRTLRAVAIVPIVEELFWRAWLMRWLITPDFTKIPLGAYSAWSFWATALLFASEHGPYWDVGLMAGIAYNWWMVRTRSLGDCIWAHAVTNACLCGFVIATKGWEYWF